MPTVNVDSTGQLLYAGTDPYLVVNNDDTNPIYLSQQQGVNGADNQLPPQASVAVSGPWYASTLTQGEIVEALVFPDATQWDNPVGVQIALNALGLATAANQSTQIGAAGTTNGYLGGTSAGALVANTGKTVGQETAALIASGSATGTPGGTPLLNGKSILLNDTGGSALSIAAGATSFPTTAAFTACGYQIQIVTSIPASDVTPFLEITMAWYDSSLGLAAGQLAAERWIVPVSDSSATPTVIYGKGPTKGNDLQIQVKNLCTTETATVAILLAGTTHHIARDDWRMPSLPTSYSISGSPTSAAGDPAAGILGVESGVSITASSNVVYLLPLYCGQVTVAFASTEAGVLTINALDQSMASGGGIVYQTAIAANADSVITAGLPRTCCKLTMSNTSASTATAGFAVTYTEYAS